MIIFRGIKFFKAGDLGYNGIVKGATLIESCLVFLRFLALFFIVIKNTAAVLCSYITSLAVQRCRVMRLPKYFQ